VSTQEWEGDEGAEGLQLPQMEIKKKKTTFVDMIISCFTRFITLQPKSATEIT
jgi:hypothetical protein